MGASLIALRVSTQASLGTAGVCTNPVPPALSYCRADAVEARVAPANSVPAAAVIRRVQALIGITGRKAHAGG